MHKFICDWWKAWYTGSLQNTRRPPTSHLSSVQPFEYTALKFSFENKNLLLQCLWWLFSATPSKQSKLSSLIIKTLDNLAPGRCCQLTFPCSSKAPQFSTRMPFLLHWMFLMPPHLFPSFYAWRTHSFPSRSIQVLPPWWRFLQIIQIKWIFLGFLYYLVDPFVTASFALSWPVVQDLQWHGSHILLFFTLHSCLGNRTES